jgi:hypothetical protein
LIEQFDITGNEKNNNIHSLYLHHVNKRGLCYKAVVKTEESGPLSRSYIVTVILFTCIL